MYTLNFTSVTVNCTHLYTRNTLYSVNFTVDNVWWIVHCALCSVSFRMQCSLHCSVQCSMQCSCSTKYSSACNAACSAVYSAIWIAACKSECSAAWSTVKFSKYSHFIKARWSVVSVQWSAVKCSTVQWWHSANKQWCVKYSTLQ